MGLDKVFGKAEKVEEEKKLETIVSSESKQDEIVFKLVEYFEQQVPIKNSSWVEVFEDSQKYLQSYQITPELVTKVNLALPRQKPKIEDYLEHKGVFLSALIQTSYQQGCNGFEFEEIHAENFGNALRGKKTKPIKIIIGKLEGDDNFWGAKNFSVNIQILKGSWNFHEAENFSASIQTLKGDHNFWDVKNFSAKIHKLIGYGTFIGSEDGIFGINYYQGINFGSRMYGCEVYSPSLQVLKKLKGQATQEGNEFILGKPPQRLKNF